jgi:hypothetical protein
MLVGKPIVNQA